MATSVFLLIHRRLSESFRGFFFIPTSLALITSLSILFYISSTSKLFTYEHKPIILLLKPTSLESSTNISQILLPITPTSTLSDSPEHGDPIQAPRLGKDGGVEAESQNLQLGSNGNSMNDEVFHDGDMFMEDYKQMNNSFRIYVYPHMRNDPFAHALLSVDFEPGGNYASESYFKKVLTKSHFITKDPSEADLFFLPFSIARLRHDPRVGVLGLQDFIKDYIHNITIKYPYWNRTGGADHFYVTCHSIGRTAMAKADMVRLNAIQVVCSSSYFLSGYIPHKDASVPQIWPRQGDPLNLDSSERKKLAFFAGAINSPVRVKLLQVWKNDSDIFAHFGRLTTPYADQL